MSTVNIVLVDVFYSNNGLANIWKQWRRSNDVESHLPTREQGSQDIASARASASSLDHSGCEEDSKLRL